MVTNLIRPNSSIHKHFLRLKYIGQRISYLLPNHVSRFLGQMTVYQSRVLPGIYRCDVQQSLAVLESELTLSPIMNDSSNDYPRLENCLYL